MFPQTMLLMNFVVSLLCRKCLRCACLAAPPPLTTLTQQLQSHLSASTARNPNKRPRAAETAVSEPVSATKRITLAPPIILLPPNLGSTVLNIANGVSHPFRPAAGSAIVTSVVALSGPKFFQEGVLVVGGNDDRLGSTASALTSATESIVRFASACLAHGARSRFVCTSLEANA